MTDLALRSAAIVGDVTAPEVGQPGAYGWGVTTQLTPRPALAACPYCHAPMTAFDPVGGDGIFRVVKTLAQRGDVWDALVQSVPPTHQMVRCLQCRQSFTVLREGVTHG